MQLKKNWKTRLAGAAERGYFTADDKRKMGDFNTCFIGEHYNKPISDKDLTREEADLGYRAAFATESDDIAEAKEIYEEVQRLYQ